jgi:hypothetical protein
LRTCRGSGRSSKLPSGRSTTLGREASKTRATLSHCPGFRIVVVGSGDVDRKAAA